MATKPSHEKQNVGGPNLQKAQNEGENEEDLCRMYCGSWGPRLQDCKVLVYRRGQSRGHNQRNGRNAIEISWGSTRPYIGHDRWTRTRLIREEYAWRGNGSACQESSADQRVHHRTCREERASCDADARDGVTWHALYGMRLCEDKIGASTASC